MKLSLDRLYMVAACTPEHLRNISNLCKKAPPGDFMECGVLRGGSAAVLIDNANCDRNVWLCDTFGEFPPKGKEDVGKTAAVSIGFTVDFVRSSLIKWGLDVSKVKFVQGLFGDTLPDTMKKIDRLALVNFDGDWYDSVMESFPHILKKLVPGGILIIHDYPGYEGLVKAVHKFIRPQDLRPFTDPREPANVYYVRGEGEHDV